MPPARALWAGGYAAFMTLLTTITAQYAQLSGTDTSIGKGAWIVAVCGALAAGLGAGKTAWTATADPPRTYREYRE